jgi:hypothetical protein
LAGAWHVEAWASAKDGVGFTDRLAAGSVTLQQAAARARTPAALTTVKSDASGKLKATLAATGDGSYQFAFAGDATSSRAASVPDAIDVQ